MLKQNELFLRWLNRANTDESKCLVGIVQQVQKFWPVDFRVFRVMGVADGQKIGVPKKQVISQRQCAGRGLIAFDVFSQFLGSVVEQCF
ncbi:hypothetical protein D3C76_733300 [compost metagenome]